MASPVLIISEDPGRRNTLSSISASCGLRAVGCESVEGAIQFLASQGFTAVLYEVSQKEDPCKAIKQLARFGEETPIIVVSNIENWDSYISFIGAGAFDYVDFPPYPGELERLLRATLTESRSRIAA